MLTRASCAPGDVPAATPGHPWYRRRPRTTRHERKGGGTTGWSARARTRTPRSTTTGGPGTPAGSSATATCGSSAGGCASPGDRLVTYAVGSAHASGTGRVFSLCEVTSDAEPGECERWPWKVELRYLAGVPLLSQSPTLDDIAVSPLSVRRQTHIVLTPRPRSARGQTPTALPPAPARRAEELITARQG